MRHTLPLLLFSTIAITVPQMSAGAQSSTSSPELSPSTVAALFEPVPFTSLLDGGQEVPPVRTTGFGSAEGLLSGGPGQFVFTYVVRYSGLTSPIAAPFAHIHRGAFGTNGPVIHDLDNRPSFEGTTSGTISGDWRFNDPTRPLTDALAQDLLAGNTYFNIHTAGFPAGEIRGQVAAVPEPTTIAGIALAGAGISFLKRKNLKRKKVAE